MSIIEDDSPNIAATINTLDIKKNMPSIKDITKTLKISLGNPYLKILYISEHFVADAS